MKPIDKWVKVITITCPKCGDEIYSRARHDYRKCSCGEIGIDGGFDYTKVAFQDEIPEQRQKMVKATKEELFKDWNTYGDKYGKIN